MRITSLNNIIRIKELKREEISVQVRNIQKLIEEHERKILELEDEFIKNLEEFNKKRFGSAFTAEALRMHHNYVEHITRKMNEHKRVLMERVRELKETLSRLEEAHKEEKLVKKLLTRQNEKAIKEERLREQKQLDDISIKRYLR
ncbi:MAG TPA: flagellar export protein FliJ [Nitrospirae bacterium]|nr:flagellar export protein FliJ [Nitrospirota bacterium]